jgi:hypothetical protein
MYAGLLKEKRGNMPNETYLIYQMPSKIWRIQKGNNSIPQEYEKNIWFIII